MTIFKSITENFVSDFTKNFTMNCYFDVRHVSCFLLAKTSALYNKRVRTEASHLLTAKLDIAWKETCDCDIY